MQIEVAGPVPHVHVMSPTLYDSFTFNIGQAVEDVVLSNRNTRSTMMISIYAGQALGGLRVRTRMPKGGVVKDCLKTRRRVARYYVLTLTLILHALSLSPSPRSCLSSSLLQTPLQCALNNAGHTRLYSDLMNDEARTPEKASSKLQGSEVSR